MAEVLLEVAWRKRGDDLSTDDAGRELVMIRRPRLDDLVELGFGPIRHYAAGDPSLAVVLLETLGELAALSPEAARAPFLHQLREVSAAAHREVRQEGDVARVERAAAAALARAASPPPPRRPLA
jgi:uncharacterized membrane protein